MHFLTGLKLPYLFPHSMGKKYYMGEKLSFSRARFLYCLAVVVSVVSATSLIFFKKYIYIFNRQYDIVSVYKVK